MAFELQMNESIASGIRRAAIKQLKSALREAEDLSAEEAVHSLRKRCKRMRALARLVRDSLGNKRYRTINELVRDAARPLISIRDGEVLLTTLDKLEKAHTDGTGSSAVRQGLESNSEEARKRVLEENNTADNVTDCLNRARKKVRQWRIAARGRLTVRGGLGQTYERGRAAYAAASIDPSIENLHEWRKQAKYLWHQVEFLAPLRPRKLKNLASRLHELTDLLGDDHDLAIFAQTLVEKQEAWGATQIADRLLPVIHERRARLEQQAFKLDSELFDTSAEEFTADLIGRRKKAGDRPRRKSHGAIAH